MRCLYCGKELALIKRLTGGSEFCSDAHRLQYQEEFNDLALSRLLEPQPPGEPEPLPLQPELEVEEIATPEPPVHAAPVERRAITRVIQKQAASQKAARARSEEPIAAMSGWLIESPGSREPEPAMIVGEEPPIFAGQPMLPQREPPVQASAREYGLQWANPVTWNPPVEVSTAPVRPIERNVEVREFSRQAPAPALTPERSRHHRQEIALPSAVGEAMDITNQPRQPAEPPVIWQAGPQPTSAFDPATFAPLLGDLARLDFPDTGFNEAGAAKPTPSAQKPPVNTQATLPEPAAAAPPPAPNEPQTPPSSALPMRPAVVLAQAPASAPPVQQVKQTVKSVTISQVAPQAKAPAPEVKPASAPQTKPSIVPARPQVDPRAQNGKNRRPEVRIIPTAPITPAASPQQQRANAPVQPAAQAQAPAPVAKPAAPTNRPTLVENKPEQKAPAAKAAEPKPAVQTQSKPEAKRETRPEAETKHASPKSTLIAAEASHETKPITPSRPAVDLGLPELHTMEEQGVWAKMPGAMKAGIAAVLAMVIGGAFYMTTYSNNAAAKVAASKGPVYELGRPMNSTGWIEDWAPNDNFRRVTLLRGSQESSDYRMQFNAQIQSKAVGWMFRGLNPRNFYVAKVEKGKTASDPGAYFVRYAVIDGRNEGRVEKPLDIKVHVGTIYQIKFEAIGANFKVWIQNQLVDQWTDHRLGSGGLGLYSEKDEVGIIQGDVNAFELITKQQ